MKPPVIVVTEIAPRLNVPAPFFVIPDALFAVHVWPVQVKEDPVPISKTRTAPLELAVPACASVTANPSCTVISPIEVVAKAMLGGLLLKMALVFEVQAVPPVGEAGLLQFDPVHVSPDVPSVLQNNWHHALEDSRNKATVKKKHLKNILNLTQLIAQIIKNLYKAGIEPLKKKWSNKGVQLFVLNV